MKSNHTTHLAALALLIPLLGAWSLPDELEFPAPSSIDDLDVQIPTGADASLDVAQTDPLTVEEIVENVQNAYESTADFSADFTQEYTNAALGDTSTSEGIVYFLRPGMMRWDYESPEFRLFLIDGENLWIWEPDEGQYYTESLDETDLPTALRFLVGEGNFAEDFDVTIDEQTEDSITLELVPIGSEGQYSMLHFTVDPATWQVVETIIFDAIGNSNRFVFSDRQENTGLDASQFTFTPPEGATRIEAPE